MPSCITLAPHSDWTEFERELGRGWRSEYRGILLKRFVIKEDTAVIGRRHGSRRNVLKDGINK